MEWQPIETAPKDGTPVLIYCPGSGGRWKVCEAWWAFEYEDGPGFWSTPHGPAGRGYMILPEAATHWMPMPEAPNGEVKAAPLRGVEPPLDCLVGHGKSPGWKRRGHRSLEVAEYMHALAEERSRHGEMEAAQWGKLARMQEQLDDVAAALGISVDKSDWWDQSTDQKVAKLIGRATVLRGLVPNA